ncbi:dual specificity protein kinase kns1 [Monosporozyma unispora]|nr:dual specificity protein kinase kns1 [Kazachstania unispora]
MSGNPGGSMRALLPTPPERGSFPLDHEGECRDKMLKYLKCMKLVENNNAPNCRLLAKEYLRCRMEKGLMTPDEWSHLGKRSRTMQQQIPTTNSNNFINDILSKQSAMLQNNLNQNNEFTNNNTNNNTAFQNYYEVAIDEDDDDENDHMLDDNDDDEEEEDDDDLIFIKQQPVSSYSYYPTKKQRTISLPQLPHVKLSYYNLSPDIQYNTTTTQQQQQQNDDDLLNLTGSSALTLDGNKKIKLNKISTDTNTTNFKTDKDGHYIYQQNDKFGENGNRFIAINLLGQGTFGKVIKCLDTLSNKYVAIKIIRSIDRYREAAKTELRILNTILSNDPMGKFQCLLLTDYFDFNNHICLVTNLYGKSIYDFMCSNGIARFPGSHIQAIARQLIRSVCFLHDLNIIHTDLKPENILLCDESYVEYQLPDSIVSTLSNRRKLASNNGMRKILKNPEIKIIDFGSAIFHNEYHPPIISTRHYRAPEIVLGLGWSYPCDIWSIACILIELMIGESLYPIHENFEHMAMMERINGQQLPEKLIEKSLYKFKHKLGNLPQDLNSTVLKHFDKTQNKLIWPEISKKTGETITPLKSIKRVMNSCDRLDIMISKILKIDYSNDKFSINWNLPPKQNWNLIKNSLIQSSIDQETFLFWYWFTDLMRKMFEFDPTKRISAKDALNHEWFNLGILDDGISNFENNFNMII